MPKFDELKHFVLINDLSIISVNETWLNDTVEDHELNIPGYSIYRQDRSDGYGGVCLYIKNVFMPEACTFTGLEPIECV